MTSRRSWLLGLALGALLSVQQVKAQAVVPPYISYQGMVMDGPNPIADGPHDFLIKYYDAAGVLQGTDHFTSTEGTTKGGIFNLQLGLHVATTPASGFYAAGMFFTSQYFMDVTIDGTTMLNRTPMWSAPYSLNSQAVNGIEASRTPAVGKLFPIPLNTAGTGIDPNFLPPFPVTISTINGVAGNGSNDIQLIAGANTTITPNVANHSITIAATGGGQITSITAGQGVIVTGPNGSGNVIVGLDPNAGSVTSGMIADGGVTGHKLDPFIAGAGLIQDGLGNLNINADNITLQIVGDQLGIKPGGISTNLIADGSITSAKIANGAVGAAQIDQSQVQRRVNGVAVAGGFMTAINPDGSVVTGTVTTNPELTRNVVGNGLNLGFNYSNSNAWLASQSFFGGILGSTITMTGNATFGTITGTPISGSSGSFTTLTSTSNSTLGTTSAALANSFGTGGNAPNVINTIGSTGGGTSATNVNGPLNAINTNEQNVAGPGGNVRGVLATGNSTGLSGVEAIGITATGNSNSSGLSAFGAATALGVSGQATWTGSAPNAAFDLAIGVSGRTFPGPGIISVGTSGQAIDGNPLPNIGMAAQSQNSTASNIGAIGTATVSLAAATGFVFSLPAGFGAGIVGYNPTGGANQYAGYFAGAVSIIGPATVSGPLTASGGLVLGSSSVTGGSYTGYTLNSGTLSAGSTLTNNGTISGGAIAGAAISNSSLSNYTLNNGSISAGSTLTNNGTIAGGSFTGSNLSGYTLGNGTLSAGSTLSNNGTIAGGAITGAAISGGTMTGTAISGGTMSGTAVTGGTISGATITNSPISGSSGSFTTLSASGAFTGTSGTFSGAVSSPTFNGGSFSGTSGTFTGAVSSPTFNGGSFTGTTGTFSGNVSAGSFSTPGGAISAPTGAFDLLTTNTAANNSILVNRGLTLNGAANQNNLSVGGSTTTTGLTTANGGLSTTSATKFADSYVLTPADKAAGNHAITIANTLVAANSTIIVMPENPTNGAAGQVAVGAVGAGSFTVQSTGDYANVTRVHYMIIGH